MEYHSSPEARKSAQPPRNHMTRLRNDSEAGDGEKKTREREEKKREA